MKKTIAKLLAIIAVFSLAGCSGNVATESTGETSTESQTSSAETSESQAEAESETSTEKVKITYAYWGAEDESDGNHRLVEEFNSSQDRIEVDLMPIPWETYMEKLNTLATGGNLPDCAIMSEAGVLQWASQDMLYDISSMYGPDDPKPLECLGFTYEGDVVAYSSAMESLNLFYNKDMFDAAGLEYPSANADEAWTWDEFVDVAKQLTLDANGNNANDPGFDPNNIVQYGCMVENLTWQLEVWALSNGAGFFDENGEVIINDPAAIEAIQEIADLYLVDHVAPLSAGLTDDGVQRSLIAGTCAMTTNGSWNIGGCLSDARDEGLNYGIAVLPYMKEKVTICTGGPNVVFNQSEHPEEAMEFLKWFAREENNWDTLIATGIWMPTLDSYYTDEAQTKLWLENPAYPEYEEAKGVLVDYAMEYTKPAAWYYVNNTVDFNALLGSVLGEVWTGKMTAEQAITENYDALVAASQGMG